MKELVENNNKLNIEANTQNIPMNNLSRILALNNEENIKDVDNNKENNFLDNSK